MLIIEDFTLRNQDGDSITIVYRPNGQTFRFQYVSRRFVFGVPVIEGPVAPHPAWLVAWFARQVAQRTVAMGRVPQLAPLKTDPIGTQAAPQDGGEDAFVRITVCVPP